MKGIRFNQPRYIIPLILLPFFYLFNYLTLAFSPDEMEDISQEGGIKTELPDPSLKDNSIKDKFDSFQQTFKHRQDYSAVLDLEETAVEDSFTTSYSAEDRRLIDSLTSLSFSKVSSEAESIRAQYPLEPKRVSQKRLVVKEDPYEREMNLFRQQMNYVDSLTHAREAGGIEKEVFEEPTTVDKESLSKVTRLEKGPAMTFNTLRRQEDRSLLTAMLDEDLVAMQGSRIRMQLLEDMQVDDHNLERGQRIFGIISSVENQRLYIKISSLVLNGEIIPVNLEVYDQDGLPGLYVPRRTFSGMGSEIGSNLEGMDRMISPEGSRRTLLNEMASDAIRNTGRRVKKEIRKSRTHLKYSTIIYLINK